MPTLPYQAVLHWTQTGTDSISVNAITQTAGGAYGIRYLMGPPNAMLEHGDTPAGGTTQAKASTLSAVAGRVTTVSWDMMYTGQPLVANGTLTVNSYPFKCDRVTQSVAPFTWTDASSTPSSTTVPTGSVTSIASDLPAFAADALSGQTRSYRVDERISGVLKAKGTYPPQPYHEYAALLYSDETQMSPIPATMPITIAPPCTGSTLRYEPTLNLIDDNFNITSIRYVGSQTMTFRLVIKTCVEYDLAPQSSLIQMAAPNSTSNASVLNKAAIMNAKLPVSESDAKKLAESVIGNTDNTREMVDRLKLAALNISDRVRDPKPANISRPANAPVSNSGPHSKTAPKTIKMTRIKNPRRR